jgi:hypothetical protein
MVKEKLRPKRIFKNKKGYYFKVNGKRKYIKFDDKKIKEKQLININIKNVLGYVKRKPKIRRTRKKGERDLTKIQTIPVVPIDKVKTEVSAIGTNKEVAGQDKTPFKGYTLSDLTDLVFSKKVVPELTIEGSIKREDKEKSKKDFQEKLGVMIESGLINDNKTVKEFLSKNFTDIRTEDLRKLVDKVHGGPVRPPTDDIPSMVGEEEEEEKYDEGREPIFLVGKKKQSTLTPEVINSLLEDTSFVVKRRVEGKNNISQYEYKDYKELGQLLVVRDIPDKLKKDYLVTLEKFTKTDRSNTQKRKDEKEIKDIVVAMYNKKIGKGVESGSARSPTVGEDKGGLWNSEIDEIFKDKLPEEFIPVISNDEIPSLLKYINKDTERFGFVINSDDSDKGGSHWKSVFISRPDASVEVYDSLVSIPNEKFIKDLYKLVDKFDDDIMYKLKINTVRDQSEKTGNCGYFAVNFLINRFKGKKFKNASLFDKVDKSGEGEKDIQKFKTFL